jgi:predicted phage baseplate assembly protein
MSIPVPNLDDRAFQSLVDEAKRYVIASCPEWTDNNVADPGVTLIETFAFIADQLIYRINRTPDLNYVKFLDLIGAKLFPPSAALADLRFWLSVPQAHDLVIPAGTQVSTVRRGKEKPITFSTKVDLALVSVSARSLVTQASMGPLESHDHTLVSKTEFECFSKVPAVGDALYIGLSQPAVDCVVRLTVDARIEGIGVDPLRPPLAYEVWDGQQWTAVEVLNDTTGGLNRRGTIDMQLRNVAPSTINSTGASWLRIRVVDVVPGQPKYTGTPRIKGLSADVIGGLVEATHAELLANEIVGPLIGTPGEAVTLSRSPLVSGQNNLEIEVSSPDGWQHWARVDSFADSAPHDRHFTVDDRTGTIRFGPVIRSADGTTRAYGATPLQGANVRVPEYFVGGGKAGNVDAHKLTLIRSAIPFVSKVDNPMAAIGGVDAESVEEVKERAPMIVRTRGRAVTPRDYEFLISAVAPGISRVKCIDATTLGAPGTVLVMVLPSTPPRSTNFELLKPQADVLESIRTFIDERRPLGTTVRIEPPRFLGVSVVGQLTLQKGASRERVAAEADNAIKDFLHPSTGGYEGDGWPFGRSLLAGEIRAVLQRLPGVSNVATLRLIPVDAVTGVRAEPRDSIDIGPLDLLFNVGNDIEAMA